MGKLASPRAEDATALKRVVRYTIKFSEWRAVVGIRDSTKQGFRVENTSTHSVRE